MLSSIDPGCLERIAVTAEMDELASRYVECSALTEKMRPDVHHIAAATVASVDVSASWNSRHMVNWWRIRQYSEVNRRQGYGPMDIPPPRQIQNED